jgi:hypothetical protein
MEDKITKLENEVAQLQQTVFHLNDLFFRTFFIDKVIFQNPVYFNGKIYFKDGTVISAGSSTGLKIGNATTEKIGFYNVTPVVQAGAITAPSGGATQDAESRTAIGQIKTALTNLGLTS